MWPTVVASRRAAFRCCVCTNRTPHRRSCGNRFKLPWKCTYKNSAVFGFCFRFACSTWGNASRLIWRIRIRNDSAWRSGNRSYNLRFIDSRIYRWDHKHEQLNIDACNYFARAQRALSRRLQFCVFWRVQICGTWPRAIFARHGLAAANKMCGVKIDKSDDGNACRGHLLPLVEFKCKRFLFFITFYYY